MSLHTKEIIIKSLLIICGACATLLCPVGIVLMVIIAEEWFYMLLNYYTLFLTGLGALTLILYGIFTSTIKDGYQAKIAESQKHKVAFANYRELTTHIESVLSDDGFEVHIAEAESEVGSISLYVQHDDLSTIFFFVTVRIPEITSDIWDELQTNIHSKIEEYFGTDYITDKIELIVLLCVDCVSTEFYKTINKVVHQNIKFTWLLTGISFGGKTAYIAEQQGGFSYGKYKKLRSYFMNVMQISTDKK
ncbi:MAG: hypothetical protein E7616_05550 [Ruminococcaceae bacterium]|nr:hypothetical protein [Oscillospiraceae bacterium]